MANQKSLSPVDIVLTKGSFRSLPEGFSWRGIPAFSVVFGENGAGKSHLLQVLRAAFSVSPVNQRRDFEATISGEAHPAWLISYVTEWNLGDPPTLQVSERAGNLNSLRAQLIGQERPGNEHQREYVQWLKGELASRAGKPPEALTHADIAMHLPEDLALRETVLNLNGYPAALSRLFRDYDLRLIAAERAGQAETFRARTGDAPWTKVNAMLSRAGLRYSVGEPVPASVLVGYDLRLRSKDIRLELKFSDLSSGEQVLIGLVFWAFIVAQSGQLPRLLLLDEPDAHLHPALIPDFLSTVRRIFVQEHGCRVVMTTHRPDTIALAPEQSLYEMSREPDRIRRAPSKSAAVGKITSRLLSVMPFRRCVLVEDEDDARFYGAFANALVQEGALSAEALPVFQPASTGRSSGGRSVVEAWVEKLGDAQLSPLVQGIIDRDNGNRPRAAVRVIGRYSIENYLADPVLILSALAEDGRPLHIDNVPKLARGDSYLVRRWDAKTRQFAADHVFRTLGNELKVAYDCPRVEVEFVGGIKLEYPCWMMERSGKEIQQAWHSAFKVTMSDLFEAVERVRIVPMDLLSIFQAILSDF